MALVWVFISMALPSPRRRPFFATATAAQGFTSGDRPYANPLAIVGTAVFSVGGGKTLDNATCAGSRFLPAGSCEMKHVWTGADSSVRLYVRTVFAINI